MSSADMSKKLSESMIIDFGHRGATTTDTAGLLAFYRSCPSSGQLHLSGSLSRIHIQGAQFISGPSRQSGIFDFKKARGHLETDFKELLCLDDNLKENIEVLRVMLDVLGLAEKLQHDSWWRDRDPNYALEQMFRDAAAAGKAKIMAFLLEKYPNRIDINKGTGSFETPLLLALQNHHYHVVEFLLERKAKVEELGSHCLIEFAAKHKCLDEFLHILEKHHIPYDHLFKKLSLADAIEKEDLSLIQTLMKHKANVNETDRSRSSRHEGEAVIFSCRNKRNMEIPKLLIAAKADINAVASNGNTLLIQATEDNNLALVELLLSQNVNINHTTRSWRYTALDIALHNGYMEIAKCLIKHGANLGPTLPKDNFPSSSRYLLNSCLSGGDKRFREFITIVDQNITLHTTEEETVAKLNSCQTSYAHFPKKPSPLEELKINKDNPPIPRYELGKTQKIGEIIAELHPDETEEQVIARTLCLMGAFYGQEASHFIKALLALGPDDQYNKPLEESLNPMLEFMEKHYGSPKLWYLNDGFFDIYKNAHKEAQASRKTVKI